MAEDVRRGTDAKGPGEERAGHSFQVKHKGDETGRGGGRATPKEEESWTFSAATGRCGRHRAESS